MENVNELKPMQIFQTLVSEDIKNTTLNKKIRSSCFKISWKQ